MLVSPDESLKSKELILNYQITKEFDEYRDPRWISTTHAMSVRMIHVRNKITAILVAPLEDIPLHINDPEPYNDLAAWRLMLPKIPDHIKDQNQTRQLITL